MPKSNMQTTKRQNSNPTLGTPAKRRCLPRTVKDFENSLLELKSEETLETPSRRLCTGALGSKTPPTTVARRRLTRAVKHKVIAVNTFKKVNPISGEFNKELCDECEIKYALEAAAIIILAKGIKKIDELWTPFGYCSLNRLSTNNYQCKSGKAIGSSTSYRVLLRILNGSKRVNKDDIIKFLFNKIGASFSIKASPEDDALMDKINDILKRPYGGEFKCNNNYAAVMCGIFVSEMIRSGGKVVRSAFSEWPRTLAALRNIFIQARPSGNRVLRDFISKSKISDRDKISLKRNAKNLSPDSTPMKSGK